MQCRKCNTEKVSTDFYANDRTCKDCRRVMVKANRENKSEQYQEYEKKRANRPDRVQARKQYQSTDAGKAAKSRASKAYQERYPMKRAAHIITGNAIRDGKLIKPMAYESCGCEKSVEAHHDNYTKPLDVRWLCDPCHKQWHKENEPIYS